MNQLINYIMFCDVRIIKLLFIRVVFMTSAVYFTRSIPGEVCKHIGVCFDLVRVKRSLL